MSDVRPLHQLGVFPLKIINVAKKESSSYKGKQFPPAIVLTLEHEDGRLIDDKFPLSYPGESEKEATKRTYAKKRFDDLAKLVGAKGAAELKGKIVAVLVSPFEWESKVIWNPKQYFDVKYLASPEAALDDLFGAPDATDNINF